MDGLKVRCGRTDMPRHYHDSIAAVRACQSSASKPTAKMLAYVQRLHGDPDLAAQMSFDECKTYIHNIKTGAGGRGGMTVVHSITRGFNLAQYVSMPLELIKDISRGYFAIDRGDGVTYDFWHIDVKKDEGNKVTTWRLQIIPKRKHGGEKIKGRDVLLVVALGASDVVSMVVPMSHKINQTLKHILIYGDALRVEYGRREGACGICGTELTDSIALGIGPRCLENNPYILEE